MKEVSVLRDVMRLGVGAVRLFRNNCGALRDEHGQWIRYGVCNPGGSDLIGWQTVTITPEMVGQRVAVFVALECKSATGRASEAQERFVAAVVDAGGIGAIVRSEGQARGVLERG